MAVVIARSFLALCAATVVFGCAAPRSVTAPAVPIAPAPSAPKRLDAAAQAAADAQAELARPSDATGTWDWLYRSSTQQGDVRIEQEEWHLQQEGNKLSGFFYRQVLMLSADQRPFRCNGMLGFAVNTRVSIIGELQGGRVSLREVGIDTDKNPCDDGRRELFTYAGQLRGDSLVLKLPPGQEQHLVRRSARAGTTAMMSIGPERGDSSPQDASLPLAGAWEWQFRAADPDGDLHVEREEWHLSESGNEISGYYIRLLERRRSSGVFACNNSPLIQGSTRYLVKGHRFGNKISIAEVDYQTTPGPCENGARRLEQYQGTLHPEGTLALSWTGGSQTLRRKP
jgi:hypothetical protein